MKIMSIQIKLGPFYHVSRLQDSGARIGKISSRFKSKQPTANQKQITLIALSLLCFNSANNITMSAVVD